MSLSGVADGHWCLEHGTFVASLSALESHMQTLHSVTNEAIVLVGARKVKRS